MSASLRPQRTAPRILVCQEQKRPSKHPVRRPSEQKPTEAFPAFSPPSTRLCSSPEQGDPALGPRPQTRVLEGQGAASASQAPIVGKEAGDKQCSQKGQAPESGIQA